MNGLWSHVTGAAALAAGALLAIPSCAEHDNTSLFVDDVLASKLVPEGQGCLFTPDPTQAYTPSGIWNPYLSGSYVAVFLVGNQLVPQANPSTPTTETSYITIQGATVKITDTAGNVLDNYTTTAAATIPPAVGGLPQFEPIGVVIVDSTAFNKIAPLLATEDVPVLTYTQFFGVTLGHQKVESNVFEFPVTVCSGCLIAPAAYCASQMPSSIQVPCYPGQDLPVCLFPASTTNPDGGAPTDAGGQ